MSDKGWLTLQLAIVVLGAAFFGWLGADDFGPKDFMSHVGSSASVFYAATRISKGGV